MRFFQVFIFFFFFSITNNLDAQEYYDGSWYQNEYYNDYTDEYDYYSPEYYEEESYIESYNEQDYESNIQEDQEEYYYTSNENEEEMNDDSYEEEYENEHDECNHYPFVAMFERISYEDENNMHELVLEECELQGYPTTVDLCFGYINRFPIVSLEEDGTITYEYGSYFCSMEEQEEYEENFDDMLDLVDDYVGIEYFL